MSRTALATSRADDILRFDKLVARCRELKAAGRIRSGVEYFINEEMRLDVRTLPPEVEIPGRPFDLDAILGESLKQVQIVRYTLSTWFDLDANEWNESAIGGLLKFISEQIRSGVNETKLAELKGSKAAHDVYRYADLHEILANMVKLILSDDFAKKPHMRKFEALNSFATESLVTFKRRSGYLLASMMADMAIVLSEMRQRLSDDESVEKLVLDLLPNLEKGVARIGTD